jgi:hyperosmotically inducible periplasmic protein
MRVRRPSTTWTLLAVTLFALIACAGCAGGPRPYRAMARAATSEESVFAQAHDDRLKLAVREAMAANGLGLHITPYAYMGHLFVVGHVDSPEQRERVLTIVQGVSGVRSVDGYLPDNVSGGTSDAVSQKASDVEIEAKVKVALALGGDKVTQIDVEALDGHVVLLGVVGSQDAIDIAASSAQGVTGVTGVTNFLLLPEAGYERLRPGLL